MNLQLSQSVPDFGERLRQFEAAWCSGQIPDVASYLREANDRQDIENLIEIDLECRWKQFDANCDPSAKDRHGFPLFPLIDDYGRILPQSLQQLIFAPHCVAEEYRVRSRWGDKPSKESFLVRFPSDRTEIEAALIAIDTDFKNEGIDVSEESSRSVGAAAEPTAILGQPARKDTELPPEAGLAGTQIGKYQLESRLGHGAFGEVWKAYDAGLKRHVAIKFPRTDKTFPADILESFRTEAQKLAALDHIPTGIVDVYDCGEHDGKPYFVSKLIEGESLADRMQRGQLPHDESAALIAKVAETLKWAHQQKLVHRDIKPANILLNAAGEPYLADFGMAATEDEQLSEGGGILGTFAYMAPEQARGECHRVDGRADIYALGVILYRLLTNELPYGGKTIEQYLHNIQHQKPRPPRQIDDTIPAELERICLKCLRKDEDERYSSAGELAKELRSRDSSRKHIGYVSTAMGVLFLILSTGLFSSTHFHDWITRVDSSNSREAGKTHADEDTPSDKVGTVSPIDDGKDGPPKQRTPSPDDNNLLAQPINEVIFDHGNISNHWALDKKIHSLSLRSYNPAMISFGSLNVSGHTISAVFENVPDTSGKPKPCHFGVFWGYREKQTLDTTPVYRAQCLLISNGMTFIKNELKLIEFELTPDPKTGMEVSDNPSQICNRALSEPGIPARWTLQLSFNENNLQNVVINGQTYQINGRLSPDSSGFADGEVGILVYTADFVVKKLYWE